MAIHLSDYYKKILEPDKYTFSFSSCEKIYLIAAQGYAPSLNIELPRVSTRGKKIKKTMLGFQPLVLEQGME